MISWKGFKSKTLWWILRKFFNKWAICRNIRSSKEALIEVTKDYTSCLIENCDFKFTAKHCIKIDSNITHGLVSNCWIEYLKPPKPKSFEHMARRGMHWLFTVTHKG